MTSPQRWPITPELKQKVVDCMTEIISSDPENAVGAARVLIAAEKQNQDDKLKRRKRDKISVNTILQLVEPTAPDPEYLEWKRQRLMEQSRLQIEHHNESVEHSGDR